ncbi:MAG TPA: cyclic-di-AMP receptor [Chloroflexota bacterium]|jgi:uncharacterized protein YaaQ|nr:cyclic-di-AMP receptor [Chloroflexota bacterium]
MKLVLGVVQDQDASNVIDALVQAEYRSTRINTSGGFLKRGNATILVGVEDDQVHDVLRIIRENARPPEGGSGPQLAAGNVFVLNVARFVRM